MNQGEMQRQAAIHGRMLAVLLPFLSRITSSSPNAIYTPKDLLDVVISLCTMRKPVATTIRAMNRRFNQTMTGQRFLQLLGGLSPDEMLKLCLDMMDACTKMLVETGRLAGEVVVAVDEHLIPWYTKKNRYSKGGRRKKGTNVFEAYITAQVVSGRTHPTVAGYPIVSGESQSRYLGCLIENAQRLGVKMKVMLLDRGLVSVDNILEMERLGVKYVMPLPGNDKLYGLMQEYHDKKGEAVQEYTMTNKHGRSATTTLVIVPKKNPGKGGTMSDLYVGFITNVEVDNLKDLIRYIPKVYRIR